MEEKIMKKEIYYKYLLETAETPSGIWIELGITIKTEVLGFEVYHSHTFEISAFPTVKKKIPGSTLEIGEKFRLDIHESRRKGYSSRDIVKDFESLKNGDKTIEDLFMYFSDEDHKCLLGIEGFLL